MDLRNLGWCYVYLIQHCAAYVHPPNHPGRDVFTFSVTASLAAVLF